MNWLFAIILSAQTCLAPHPINFTREVVPMPDGTKMFVSFDGKTVRMEQAKTNIEVLAWMVALSFSAWFYFTAWLLFTDIINFIVSVLAGSGVMILVYLLLKRIK